MTQIKLEAKWDMTDADRGAAQYHRYLQKIDQETKELAKNSRRAGSQAGSAFRNAGNSAKTAGSDVNRLKTETSGFEKAAGNAAISAKNFILGFAGISGIVAAMKSIVADVKDVAELRKEFSQITLEIDKLSKPLATLSGDVSQAGINKASQRISSNALRNRIPLETSAAIAYKADSVFAPGSKLSDMASDNAAKMAAALEMSLDAAEKMPNIMKLADADTQQEQSAIMNMVGKGASISVAKTPEYVENLPEVLATGIMREYSKPDTLAMYNAMIAATGGDAARGAEMTKRYMATTSGRNKKAMEFLSKLSQDYLGKDLRQLSDPERQKLAAKAFEDYKASGRQDEMKELDTKGYEAIMLGNTTIAQEIMANAPGEIQAAADSGMVESKFQQHLSTDMAKWQNLETQQKLARAQTGRSNLAATQFKFMTDTILEQSRANLRGYGEHARMFMRPDRGLLQEQITRQMLFEAYNRYIEQYGNEGFANKDPGYKQVRNLMLNIPAGDIEAYPEFLNQLYEATGGFQLDSLPHDTIFNRGLSAYKNANPAQGPVSEAALKENTQATNQLNQTLQKLTENNVMIDTGD